MQIGTRWRGDEPAPEQIPAELRAAIADAAVDPCGYWTLTWLEHRPVAEHDDGIVLALGPDGTVGTPPGAVLDEPDVDADDEPLFPVE